LKTPLFLLINPLNPLSLHDRNEALLELL